VQTLLIWVLSPLALTAIVAAIVAARFAARARAEAAAVRRTPLSSATIGGLPPLMATCIARTGLGKRPASWFRIEQRGEMRLKPDDVWRPFRATQVYSVAEPQFVWHARMGAFRVVDSLVAGRGRLEARLLGVVPVAKSGDDDTTGAQLLRYLAEIVWVPGAIAGNSAVTWQQVDEKTALGRIEHRGTPLALRFTFDADGDIIAVDGARTYGSGSERQQAPWRGRFSDYREIGGVRIPSRAEVRWQLDGGPFDYWRATITDLSYR
jgi:hypothetical protein